MFFISIQKCLYLFINLIQMSAELTKFFIIISHLFNPRVFFFRDGPRNGFTIFFP